MTVGLLIPADEEKAIEVVTLNDFTDYQELVGGTFEALDLDEAGASLFVNDEGKLLQLDGNRRATVLWWFYVRTVIGLDQIAGDVVLVGMPDDEGETQDVPRALRDLLLDTQSYRVEFERAKNPDQWRRSGEVLYSWADACEYGFYLLSAYPDIQGLKLVAA